MFVFRCSILMVGEDVCHHLGFLKYCLEIQVAISHACALFVVVGNPLLLAKVGGAWHFVLEACRIFCLFVCLCAGF